MGSQKIFIAVAGNIGTGKTTLTSMIAERLGFQARFESVGDNPYLEDFYSDMNRWSFPLQIYFLNHRATAHRDIVDGTSSAIQDRTIYEDANIFARNLHEQGYMEERDFKNYLTMYDTVCSTLQAPDLMIYLRKSLPVLQAQIKKRGRDYEQNIPEDYLANLNRYYDEWMADYKLGKKLIIDSDNMDFVGKPADFEDIFNQVASSLDQRDLFISST